MEMKLFDTISELDHYAAQLFAATLNHKPHATLGLATGSTPIGIYEKMIEMYRKGKVSFKEATTFNLDEYVGLPENHEQGYAHYMRQHLFAHIDLPSEQAHLPNGNAENLHEECEQYDRMLTEQPVDVQLLGLGHNGHIGFNEPDGSLQGGTHIVELKEETRVANARFFDSLDEVPKQAITMGVGSILKANTILLVVKGADKAEIVKQALTGPITTECPASLLQTHANVIVLLDKEAGRLL
ncbi:glucosamine-6-phosphate deaminase 1 [Paenibacillus baekrokdamisoli]|uniref:Glucosamine-6-phosphate deaminase n=1 Tax=Paenibacillus baekrokdamisoli TaxID=1712516 RepID=A0A3G9IRG7_9BACL|nr:glucosamine-6-phosphate deaminase [Paenibacillus baekrokdamisoli]MBB3071050.1 glucosamine-6-phosphate deaminase [Paenibacillus baekrokdamisoli]BBH21467.1 glucosamine-6-phosphate deaminase 1 [Paenibacillus baekrokdamisoli]